MAKILVSGLINIETTLQVDKFPITYTPVRYPFYGVNSTVSGVGYNVAKALTVLGNQVNLLSLVAHDPAGNLVRRTLAGDKINDMYVLDKLTSTPQSVILFDPQGKRQINVDLKDVQDHAYPTTLFDRAREACSILILCNINFSRPLLTRALETGLPIATDVHTIASLEDGYNRDFMQAAHILFMSDESLPKPPEAWSRAVLKRYQPDIVVIGLGSKGALLATRKDQLIKHFPAVHVQPVSNTIGAGDALFSAFIHIYLQSGDPQEALAKATVFAAHKISGTSGGNQFLTHQQLESLVAQRR